MKTFFIKWYKWEYWPFWFFYIPIYFYWLWLSLKARSLFFFTASNPLMELGGLMNYSKSNILKEINSDFLPKLVYIESQKDRQQVLELLKKAQISFPLVAKPDVGERGKSVRKIDHENALQDYLADTTGIIILQEFVTFPLEFGVLYYRFPNEPSGYISSIVQKGFLTVTGDGKSSILELLEQHNRGQFYVKNLIELYPKLLEKHPQIGEEVLIEPIGNHSRGTVFLNANHLMNEKLVQVFDKISEPIQGFSFGRYDFKVSSLDDLYAGKNIKIMELNGVNSEPAHIYDPKMPIWKAYRDLLRHWHTIYQVSIRNHKELGVSYTSVKEGFAFVFPKKSR